MKIRKSKMQENTMLIKDGIELGRDEGIEEATVKIARKLKKLGIEKELISKATGLSKSYVKEL